MLKEELPDITSSLSLKNSLNLQWVGMEGIAVPLKVEVSSKDEQVVGAKTSIYVGLDKAGAKGIHMSRLHKVINQLYYLKCDKVSLDELLKQSIDSQDGLSQNARIRVEFDLILKKKSLLSKNTGFQNYSIMITAETTVKDGCYELEVTIPYSSTCPCSASLARQLYSHDIDKRFAGIEAIDKQTLLEWIKSPSSSFATPHSQRSYAHIRIKLNETPWPSIQKLIFDLEKAIGTPVQSVVKRVDEQEFARLNGENLMFCEDAARRLKQYLEESSFAIDYWFKVEHQESLHAHNAVVIDQKYT